jgi:predicted small lipoprotein YifL
MEACMKTMIVAVLLSSLAGCGRYAVRPDEKEFLADRIMQTDFDSQDQAVTQHVLTNREAAQGGYGAGGGGCGCN